MVLYHGSGSVSVGAFGCRSGSSGDTNKYKVFLLPEELTPDTATLYNNIVNEQHDFLNSALANSKILNKTLHSGEHYVVTIGVLIPKPSNSAAIP